MLAEPITWLVPLLLGWGLLVGLPFAVRRPYVLPAVGVGFLRRGKRGAFMTALTVLHADGLVGVSRRGLTRSRKPMRSGVDPFAAAVYAAMPAPTGARVLRGRTRVRRGLATLTRELARVGLVPGRTRWWLARGLLVVIAAISCYQLVGADRSWGVRLPYLLVMLAVLAAGWARRRTIAGYRALRAQRREHADLLRSPIDLRREQHSPGAVATAYALGGGVLMPGLTNVWGRPSSDHYPYPDASRSDGFPYDAPDW